MEYNKENPDFDTLEIKVKYFVDDIEPLDFIGGIKSDWIDLRVAEDIELKAFTPTLVRLGVGMILPDGYEAEIRPRSSTAIKYGIIQGNSVGTIDNSYSGDNDEWKWSAIALKDIKLEKNTRICQFRIIEKQPKVTFIKVDHLNDVDRGGSGSTGSK